MDDLFDFLQFIGFEDGPEFSQLKQHVQQSKYDMTGTLLLMAAQRTGESLATINRWFDSYKKNKPKKS